MRLLPVILLAACGGRAPAPAPVVVNDPFPPVPPDAAPADAWPEVAPEPVPEPPPVEEPVGAMPVPPADDEWAWYYHPPIEALDTTITEDELPWPRGKWQKRVTVKDAGEVMLVFQVRSWEDGAIVLAVVHGDEASRFVIGRSDDAVANPFDGVTVHAYQTSEDVRATGPILFAARIKPRGAKVLHQFVVYTRGSSVFTVERPLGGKSWKRRLRVDFPAETTFLALTNSDPH